MGKNNDIFNSLESVFAKHDREIEQSRSQLTEKKTSRKNIEIALTVLLVDLASCDQAFSPKEYQVISSALRRMFGISHDAVSALVNQANQIIAGLRGTSEFAETIRDEMTLEERKTIMKIIDEMIMADGKVDAFEEYLRQRFITLLQIE